MKRGKTPCYRAPRPGSFGSIRSNTLIGLRDRPLIWLRVHIAGNSFRGAEGCKREHGPSGNYLGQEHFEHGPWFLWSRGTPRLPASGSYGNSQPLPVFHKSILDRPSITPIISRSEPLLAFTGLLHPRCRNAPRGQHEQAFLRRQSGHHAREDCN
jgi:hypothetical protein